MVDKSNIWFTEGVENSFRGMVATAKRNSHRGGGVGGVEELVPEEGCCGDDSIADRTEVVALLDLGRCHFS